MVLFFLLFIMTKAEESENLNSKITKQKRITSTNKSYEHLNNQTSRKSLDEKTTQSSEDEEDKKTLAQQVLDGKYGLIQTELFSSPAKRPGIISYEVNPEVPKDNINNFGGLQPDEIWLAENHLLVLKGGTFNEDKENTKVTWPPIDNYIAPHRLVKIPPNPKIPPPFPVQLRDGGPIEFIEGRNDTKVLSPFLNPLLPPPFFPPSFVGAPFDESRNDTAPKQGNFTQGNGKIPFPFLPPRIGFYPPAAAFLPPPGNLTELDEDDPSIYYPPKYDFIYTKSNFSHVPPGPLVPGIILPPPPDFFGEYKNNSNVQKAIELPKLNNSLRKPNKTRGQSSFLRLKNTMRQNDTKTKEFVISPKPKSHTSLSLINNIKNEVYSVKPLVPNVTYEEWIPIPAPRPFYITGLKGTKTNENNKYTFQFDTPPKNGWVYQNVSHSVDISDQTDSSKKKNEDVVKQNRYYLPPISGKKLLDEENIYSIKTLIKEEDDIKLNEGNNRYSEKEIYPTTRPKSSDKKTIFLTNKPHSETNTIPAKVVYEDVTIRSPVLHSNVLFSKTRYPENGRKTILTTKSPLSFFYFSQEPKFPAEHTFSYDLPVNSALNFKSQQPNYRLNIHNNERFEDFTSTTKKPPVYEYSYSAPGYGSIEAPKIGINDFATTPRTTKFRNSFRPVEPRYTLYEYQQIENQKRNNFKTWNPEQYYTTETSEFSHKPEYLHLKPYSDNPYKINTEVSLLDSITKKYFTVFGQKINQEPQITTPLPNIKQKFHRPFYETHLTTGSNNEQKNQPDVKYSNVYNSLSSNNFYAKQNNFSPVSYRGVNKVSKTNVQPTENYSYFYSDTERDPQYHTYEYESDSVRPNHPLDTDIAVNFKVPPATVEPEAEFIHSRYINPINYRGSSAFVSYRLPGNGGHFYFLTPQRLPLQTYHKSSPLRYPEVEKQEYVVRNVRQ